MTTAIYITNKWLFSLIITSFLIGILSTVAFIEHRDIGFKKGFKDGNWEIKDYVPFEKIHLEKDYLYIEGHYDWGIYTNTDSMLPILDSNSTGIYRSDIEPDVGDIAAYELEGSNYSIIHRIVDKGIDEHGEYFIFKGENLIRKDKVKVRRDNITRVLVGVIW